MAAPSRLLPSRQRTANTLLKQSLAGLNVLAGSPIVRTRMLAPHMEPFQKRGGISGGGYVWRGFDGGGVCDEPDIQVDSDKLN